jgi:hypothetical protein
MMTKQWGHARENDGARANDTRAAAPVTLMGVALAAMLMFALFAALSTSAKAEEYTPHLRHVAVHRAERRGRRHAGAHVRLTSAHAGRATRFRTIARRRVEERVVSGRRRGARERLAVARSTGRSTPAMRRVSARRRRTGRRYRNAEPEVLASAKSDDRASQSANGIYASGVSRPEVTATVEAAPEQPGAQLMHSAPSDLVGAPQVASQRVPRSTEDRSANQGAALVAAEVPPPTHMEMAEAVEQPVVLPGLYRNGRLLVPPPMRGTREILVHQNLMADEEGLRRVQDDDDLRRMRADRMLVDFQDTAALHVNAEMGADRRCARPWAVRFVDNIAQAYYTRFHEPLQLNSAVRTVAYQVRLRRVNGNAAGIDGDVASPHLTGEAIDFGKHGMSMAQIAWMRAYLRPLMQDGKVDVEEEFQQACFHISVYRSYAPDLPVMRGRYARNDYPQVQGPQAHE